MAAAADHVNRRPISELSRRGRFFGKTPNYPGTRPLIGRPLSSTRREPHARMDDSETTIVGLRKHRAKEIGALCTGGHTRPRPRSPSGQRGRQTLHTCNLRWPPSSFLRFTPSAHLRRRAGHCLVAQTSSEAGMQNQVCNDNRPGPPGTHGATRPPRSHEGVIGGIYKTGLAREGLSARGTLAEDGHTDLRGSQAKADLELSVALIRAMRLALLLIGLGSALAFLGHWAGQGAALIALILIGLRQWRRSSDLFHCAVCLLTVCTLAITMLSSSTLIWGDWRLGLAGYGFVAICSLALFVGQAVLEYLPRD